MAFRRRPLNMARCGVFLGHLINLMDVSKEVMDTWEFCVLGGGIYGAFLMLEANARGVARRVTLGKTTSMVLITLWSKDMLYITNTLLAFFLSFTDDLDC
jgi:hypothetical protein